MKVGRNVWNIFGCKSVRQFSAMTYGTKGRPLPSVWSQRQSLKGKTARMYKYVMMKDNEKRKMGVILMGNTKIISIILKSIKC